MIWKYKYDYKNNKKGHIYEQKVSQAIKKALVKKSFEYVNGGIFYYQQKAFETDGYLISDSFLVICEIKLYQGEIVGSSTDDKLKIYNKNHKKPNFVNNPILQAQRNLNHTFKIIGKNVPYAYLIIVPNISDIQIKDLESHIIFITDDKIDETISMLDDFAKKQIPIINKGDVKTQLNAMKAKTNKEKKDFKKLIQKEKYESKSN
ncbi:nuclease-related domain-containing protein [Mycoplasma sp. 6243]|uniref:nuclease-related domain-containing protein n=1 Tax=Mycoplasma sp. 6243 TaxID=3440865 RepID=UPI003EB8B7F5